MLAAKNGELYVRCEGRGRRGIGFSLAVYAWGRIEFEVIDGINIDGAYRSVLKKEMICYV